MKLRSPLDRSPINFSESSGCAVIDSLDKDVNRGASYLVNPSKPLYFCTKFIDMYPEDLIAPMRQELTTLGFNETRSAEEVDQYLSKEGTTLVVINSVCGCAAGSARPAVKLALDGTEKKPSNLITAFAGNDVEGVNRARSLMAPFPPSSPSMALFKNGELVHMIERHHIEGRTADMIAENLKGAFEEHC